ncbi:Protein kinase, putative [Hondaea fermentalgiana]|uniref:dual-specificity kinase n=1 Tax=Hondaea fermentalgiana TaxID=2315210 RepID=A0A2R5G2M9_9STRA|nr:Protein kinase, putative [Hondaea fermentalgiana]|eukprot:GBG25260.1 Protein kinase, putative [Hondaea fermentalgiana]
MCTFSISCRREETMAKQDTLPAERRILSGPEALQMCPDLLADYERNEICAFDKVYYIGSQTSKIARTAHGAFDTAEGEYIYVKGEQIAFRYELESKLGHGSFGQVFRCRDHQTQQQQAASIAIKMIRSVQRFRAQALVELRVLQRIRDRDPQGVSRVVTLLDHFWFRDHLCLVFPMYSKNLYEILRANEHHGLAEKPSRFYRAPEVILGAPTGVAVDMWSCGCVLAELMVGLPLFPGQNELEQLALIVAIRGQPIREGATRWSKFFHRSSGAPRWTQNTSFPKPGSLSLRRALAASTFSNEHLIEIVCKCLVYDPRTRIEPKAALKLLAEASS